MGTARERNFWDLGLGKALRPPCRRDPRLWGRTVWTRPGSPTVPGVLLDKLFICPIPCAASLHVEPQPDACQRRDAGEPDQG